MCFQFNSSYSTGSSDGASLERSHNGRVNALMPPLSMPPIVLKVSLPMSSYIGGF